MCEGKKKIRYGNYYYIWDSKYIKNQSIDPTYLFFSEFIESIFREFKNQHLGWIDGSIVVWLVGWLVGCRAKRLLPQRKNDNVDLSNRFNDKQHFFDFVLSLEVFMWNRFYFCLIPVIR